MVALNNFGALDNVTRVPDSGYMPIFNNMNFSIGISIPKFKKNDTVSFKFRGKILAGKITKIGKYGVDVKSNNGYYYCHDINVVGFFQKSNQTKNYT